MNRFQRSEITLAEVIKTSSRHENDRLVLRFVSRLPTRPPSFSSSCTAQRCDVSGGAAAGQSVAAVRWGRRRRVRVRRADGFACARWCRPRVGIWPADLWREDPCLSAAAQRGCDNNVLVSRGCLVVWEEVWKGAGEGRARHSRANSQPGRGAPTLTSKKK